MPHAELNTIAQILEIVIKRYAFPEWCDVQVEPDDTQTEYAKHREMLKVLYLNIQRVKEFQTHVFNRIS